MSPQSLVMDRLVWFGAAAILGAGLSMWLAPTTPVFQENAKAQVAVVSALAGQFGATESISSVAPKASEVRLVGVLAGGDTGSVLISVKNGPSRLVSMHETTTDGWSLIGVEPQRVRLSYFGAMLDLPRPAPAKLRGITEATPPQ